MAQPLKPFSSAPREYDSTWADSIQSAINQLIGQAQNPTLQKGFPALNVPSVDPTTAQIPSKGSRTSSVSTPITFTFTATTVSFFWDGINGSSQALRIGRDDGTVIGPITTGSGLTVTGLSANTYFFYAYWNEAQQKVLFATVPHVSVGTPPIAFLAPNFLAAQQQIMRGNIPLGLLLVTTGITLTGGTGSGSGGSGGGGAGAGGNRGPLQ